MATLRRCSVVLLVAGLCWATAGPVARADAAPAPAMTTPAVAMTTPDGAMAASADMAAGSADPAGGVAEQPLPADYVEGCPIVPEPGKYTCYSLHRTGYHRFVGSPQGYGPTDLHSAYALPALTSAAGTGQTVYVIDAFGYPNAEADLAKYRAQYGLPACTAGNGCFKKLDQNGNTSTLPMPSVSNEGWVDETALDLDMVSAVCPQCHITLIQAIDNGNNLFLAVDRANTLGAKYVSMSWGGPEDGSEPRYDIDYFSKKGVVYSASSGDGAYGDGVSYPSTSKNAVAVGGTSLVRSSTPRGWSETVWDDPARSFGTGSGCSRYVLKPVWQQFIASSVCSKRAGNDVSAVADPDTGVAVYRQGSSYGDWSISGGTSASAPIIAAVYALAGAPASDPSTADVPASYPYAKAGALNDVVAGRNGTCTPQLLCTAAAGWDGPTGLGTPKGVTAFAQPKQVITLTNPGDQSSAVGGAVSLALSATDTPARAVTWSATGLPPGLTISTGTTSGGTTSGRITGSPTANGVYAVTVTASDVTGAGASMHLTWTVGRPGTYVPLTGARLLDTRSGVGAPAGQLSANRSMTVQISGRGGVPASGVSAVVLNTTAVNPAGTGWITISATGADTSNLNYTKGQTAAGLVVTQLSGSGQMNVFSSAQSDVLADVVGYYLAGAVVDAGGFTPLRPARLLDTRRGIGAPSGKVPAGGSVSLQAAGRGGVPSSGAGAVAMNVTAVSPTGTGYVTVHPDLVAKPDTSNLNFLLNRTVPNLAAVPVSSNGKVRLAVSGASSDLLADVFGYYRAGTPTVAGAFGALTAARVLDTRTGRGIAGSRTTLAAGSTTRVRITGQGGVPTTGVSAVVVNLTAFGATGGGWATLYADGKSKPPTSNLNYARGQTVANLVMVPVSPQGYVQVSVNGSGTTGLFADVAGYYASGG